MVPKLYPAALGANSRCSSPILGVPLRTLSGLKLDALNPSYGANILVATNPISVFFILSVRKNRLPYPTINYPSVIIAPT
jgi:hypothetical protein